MKDLFSLLPTVHRLRDAAEGDPLRALLNLVHREVQQIEDDIGQLYDNWFIETCEEWVVPYIADLLGVKATAASTPVDPNTVSGRSLVANTLAYRRRKGTAAVLEQLAADITGWPCKVVEFFERTASTQHVNHPRPAHQFTLDVRSGRAMRAYETPFERASHLAEVRHIDNGRGRYNVPNVGLFLYRLQSYLLQDVSARQVDPRRYTCDPLGHDGALFNVPPTAARFEVRTAPRTVVDMPLPISRLALHEALGQYYGSATTRRSLLIAVADAIQPQSTIAVCNLADAGAGWAHPAPAGKVAVDPERGRIAFDAVPAGEVTVSYAYGFGGDLGGGPYDRRASLDDAFRRGVSWQMGVVRNPPPSQTQIVATLGAAVKEWNKQPPGTSGVIALMDSRTYEEDLTSATARIAVPEGSQLLIVAAKWPAEIVNGTSVRRTGQIAPVDVRPHLKGQIDAIGTAPAGSSEPGRLVVNGVLLEGTLRVRAGHLGGLDLAHTTLAPGASTLVCDQNPSLSISLTRVICGDVTPGVAADAVRLRDCIVRGAIRARDLEVDASTIFGTTEAETLAASNSLFLGTVTAARRQEGCVRFSYLPVESESPRRFRCQPESAATASRVRPRFESVKYGEPAFAQLAGATADAIVSGADDEGEMGAWHFVHAPSRLRHLRRALDEYLRFGLEAGTFIVPQQPASAVAPEIHSATPRRARTTAPSSPRAGRSARATPTSASPKGKTKPKKPSQRKPRRTT
jgi:hypothetical protein